MKALGVAAGQLLARDNLADLPTYHVVAGHEVMISEMKAMAQKEGNLEDFEHKETVAGG